MFGIEIAGDARAYPLRILDWHEMLNDVVGGVPVTLAYCTLCGSGILYDARVPGHDEPFVFGSSGFIYRSNKLMYDQATHSLWSQFTGRPVVGPLTGSGIELAVLPVTITSWRDWRARHPDTKVLSLDTGYERDYTPGQPYGDYFASAELMFPTLVPDERLAPKDYVFALRADGREQAWPLADFRGGRVINAAVGRSAGGAGRRRGDPHGARLRIRRPRLRGGIGTHHAGRRGRDLADRGGRADRPPRRAPAASARPHRVLVRLAGLHRRRAARRTGRG